MGYLISETTKEEREAIVAEYADREAEAAEELEQIDGVSSVFWTSDVTERRSFVR